MARAGHRLRGLRSALTLGGQVPAAVGGLLAALLLLTLGATVEPSLGALLALDLGDGWGLLQPWRYLTWPFVEGPLPASLITLLFAGLMLVWLGRQLTAAWGERGLLLRVAAITGGASLLTVLLLAPFGWEQRVHGIWPLVNALLVCWGLLYQEQRLSWFGVVEMRGLTVARIIGWGTPAWALLLGPPGLGPLERLAVYTPHLGGLLVAWLLVGTGPRRGWRRVTGRWREARLKKARSRFEVVDPGPRPPREWMN
jgi:membrane associated rhomboid family serine protease